MKEEDEFLDAVSEPHSGPDLTQPYDAPVKENEKGTKKSNVATTAYCETSTPSSQEAEIQAYLDELIQYISINQPREGAKVLDITQQEDDALLVEPNHSSLYDKELSLQTEISIQSKGLSQPRKDLSLAILGAPDVRPTHPANSVDSTTAYESGVVQSESTTSIKRPEQEVTASTKLSVKEASQEMTVTDESLILKNAKENVQVMVSAFHTSQNSKEKLEAAEEVEKDDEVASDSGKSEVPEEKPNISLEKNQLASSLVSAVSNLELLSTINAEVMNQPPEILSERVPNHNLKPTVVASPISFEIPPRAESTPLRDIPESVVGNEVETLREGSSKKQLQKAVPHRKRQKTITLCSQLSQDIENAFKESKNSSQVFNEQAFVEAQERIQALILAKENEWNEKNQKIYEEMDLWQHKAVERGLVIYEYERVMRLLIEALKSSAHKTSQNRSTKVLLGGPGPEKIISPEELALIQKERDQLSEDVISWETSYDELYKRYEKLRQTSLEIKKKDDGIKEAYGKLESRYEMLEQNFQTLRIQAENELERANVEMERLEKVRENDTLGLRLKVKHLETKNNALAASLEAKVKEIADMEALFEDVVRKADRTLIQDSIND